MELTNEFTVPVPVERAWEVLTDVELIAPCLPGATLQEVEGDEYRGVVKVKVGPITAEYKGAATFRERDAENRKVVLDASGRDTRGQGSASAIITATMTESTAGGGPSTHVVVETDLTIKGKVAQFGRGMIAEVSGKLLTQFVECLEGKLDGSAPAPAASQPAAAAPAAAATVDEDVEAAATAVQGGGDLPTETLGSPAAEAAKDQAKTSTPASSPAAAAPTAASDGAPEPAIRKVSHAASEPVDLLDAAGAPLAKRLVPAIVAFLLLVVLGRWRSNRRHT